MALIRGGAFMMGSNRGSYVEKPVHRVELDSFCLDKHEVTIDAYGRCVAAGACTVPAPICVSVTWPGDHPVTCVDWYQARAYCLWQDKDLPTEAQWEYAARGGSRHYEYPWGFGSGVGRACFMNVRDGLRDGPCPVGSFPPEAFGLYDMSANVTEWTFDWFHETYPEKVPNHYAGPTSPQFPDSPKRTWRGGSWEAQFYQGARATARGAAPPGTYFYALGFRCAR